MKAVVAIVVLWLILVKVEDHFEFCQECMLKIEHIKLWVITLKKIECLTSKAIGEKVKKI